MNNQEKLNTAIEELKYALAATYKGNRDHYINNAIRFIEESMAVPTIKPGDTPKQSCPFCGSTGIHYCRGLEVVE